MRVKSPLIILSCASIAIAISCRKENETATPDQQSAVPKAESFTADFNQVKWSCNTNSLQFRLDTVNTKAVFNFSSMRTEGSLSFTAKVKTNDLVFHEASYTFDTTDINQLSYHSYAKKVDDGYLVQMSKMAGALKITVIDAQNKKVSGTIEYNWYSGVDSTSGTLKNGVFEKVPYSIVYSK